SFVFVLFFFQAEDGIRDRNVTGVQTCALPISATAIAVPPLAVGVATLLRRTWFSKAEKDSGIAALFMGFFGITEGAIPLAAARRSEDRRVGKEWRGQRAPGE